MYVYSSCRNFYTNTRTAKSDVDIYGDYRYIKTNNFLQTIENLYGLEAKKAVYCLLNITKIPYVK